METTKNKIDHIRIINLVIIIAALLYYNQMLFLNQELAEANATIAAFSEGGQTQQEASGAYQDGTYQGSAQGFGGTVTVQVTVENGNISNVEILSAEQEDAAYYNMALDVLDQIIEKQSSEVDAVSGATYTSNGIINGAKAALEQAGGKSK